MLAPDTPELRAYDTPTTKTSHGPARKRRMLRKAATMFSRNERGKNRKGTDLACIFVHAGAGYHSRENEFHHLKACQDACKAGMAVMESGGSAVDAVEITIKVLEDREITNAGYGSNLGMGGVVECDAIVVDHTGTSGAAGAVAQIKNPVSLARLVLDHSTKSLSLRRVPPNLLVGQGATDFAKEHGMIEAAYDDLISPGARGRWRKWRSDMIKTELRQRRDEVEKFGISPLSSSDTEAEQHKRTVESHDQSERDRKAHEDKMYAEALAFGAQTVSPPPSDSFNHADDTGVRTPDRHPDEASDPNPLRRSAKSSRRRMVNHPFTNSTQSSPPDSYTYLPGLAHSATDGDVHDQDMHMEDLFEEYVQSPPRQISGSPLNCGSRGPSMIDGNDGCSDPTQAAPTVKFDSSTGTYHVLPPVIVPQTDHIPAAEYNTYSSAPAIGDEDIITDTVGAIAIDMFGNIACAASSGGIGMKHRGRVGPAALVGIGAAVIPVDEDDPEAKTVATVTSGTGEHMTTTMAAALCSERLYQSQRKVRGRYEDCMEEEAMAGFIKTDFMAHPSVRQSQNTGAIGALSIKKTTEGIYFLFGHNTDSFALASMHSDEDRPVLTMSRSNGNGGVAQGGRYVRYRRASNGRK